MEILEFKKRDIKLHICKNCQNYNKNSDKCSRIACRSHWLNIINSKTGKCPINKF